MASSQNQNPQFSGITFTKADSGLYVPDHDQKQSVHLDLHCSVQPHYIVDPRPQPGQIVVPPAQVTFKPEMVVSPTPVNVQVVVKSATYRIFEGVRDRWNAAVFYLGGGATGVVTVVGLLMLVAVMIALLSLPFIYGRPTKAAAAVAQPIHSSVTFIVVSGQASAQTASEQPGNGTADSQAPKHDGWMPCPQGMVSVYTVVGVGSDGLRVRSEAKADSKTVSILPEGSVVYRDPDFCFVSPEGLWVPVTFYPKGDVERHGYISAPIYLKPGIVKP